MRSSHPRAHFILEQLNEKFPALCQAKVNFYYFAILSLILVLEICIIIFFC